MKNLKSFVTFMTIAAIFCLSLPQNVFAEETHMAYKLKELQPYVDELNSINEELGTDLVMLLSSQEDIDLAYSSYSNMKVDEFREYIIKLYNNETRVECAPSEFNIETYGVVLPEEEFDDIQRAYIYSTDSCLEIYSKCYKYNYTSYYQSIIAYSNSTLSYPAYRSHLGFDHTFNKDQTSATFTFTVHLYVSPGVYKENSQKTVTFTLWAGGADTFVGVDI